MTISDPWSFMSQVGVEPLLGTVSASREADGDFKQIVVVLLNPVVFEGTLIRAVEASPRHERTPSSESFLGGAVMPANIVAVDIEPEGTDPLALVGDIRITP